MGTLTLKDRAGAVGDFVAGKIARLQRGLLTPGPGASAARATLAKLRRLGMAADSEWMLVGDELFEGWPEDALGQPVRSEGPTRELLAVQAALRFYGMHQQSQKLAMAMDGRAVERGRYNGAFGWACRRIDPNREPSGGVQRHLSCMEGAVDFDGVLYQVQGLIPRLRAAGVPLDYYVFASDLYLLQFEAARSAVFARWAKDYFIYHSADADAEERATAE